jgi:hypothetical protein
LHHYDSPCLCTTCRNSKNRSPKNSISGHPANPPRDLQKPGLDGMLKRIDSKDKTVTATGFLFRFHSSADRREQIPMSMNVMYWTDGNGFWLRREWAEQCPESVFLASRCQGIKGHKGLHWCYKPDGSFAWDDNDDDPQEDGCSGTTPPSHKSWISPLTKQVDYWLNHFTDRQITDPETIARLEQHDPPEGDDASINRPVDMDTLDPELRRELEARSKRMDRTGKPGVQHPRTIHVSDESTLEL